MCIKTVVFDTLDARLFRIFLTVENSTDFTGLFVAKHSVKNYLNVSLKRRLHGMTEFRMAHVKKVFPGFPS